MVVLSKVRCAAFLVLLAAALGSGGSAFADDPQCAQSQGPCSSCDTPPGYCRVPFSQQCDQYEECSYVAFCGGSGGNPGFTLCWCGPCDQ